MVDLASVYHGWIEESLNDGNGTRDGKWTESVAVGSESFVTSAKQALGTRCEGRALIGGGGSFELREDPAAYRVISGPENAAVRHENEYAWDTTSEKIS